MATTHDLTARKLFNVDGLVAVVTGGGTGIGLMCVQALAANGARVYISSRRGNKLQQSAEQHQPSPSLKGSIIPIESDVTSKESLEHLVSTISSRESSLDLLICSAGISGPSSSEYHSKLWNSEDFASWGSVFATNVSAVYFTVRAFLPLLRQGSSSCSSVITVSSMSGLTKSSQGHFAYNSAKAAVIHLTKMMAAEFANGGVGVRVNSIAPGYFPSEMTTGRSDAQTAKSDQFVESPGSEHWVERKKVPAERAGSDEEMAQATLFLARCGYVNGETLTVDGGALLTMGMR